MRALIVMTLALPAAACMSHADAPLSPSLGAAVASMDAQIIDPTPATGLPVDSGARSALAIRRLETGKVKPPPGPGYGSVGAQDQGAPDQGGDSKPAQNTGSQK